MRISVDMLDQPLEAICVCLVRSEFCVRIQKYIFNSLSEFDGYVADCPLRSVGSNNSFQEYFNVYKNFNYSIIRKTLP